MEKATHRLELDLSDKLDPDPERYDVVNGKVYLKDDHLSYLDGYDNSEYPIQTSPSSRSPNAKYKTALKHYTGTWPNKGRDVITPDYPTTRTMIRGYSGFLPQTQSLCGVPLIANEKLQSQRLNSVTSPYETMDTRNRSPHSLRYSSMQRESGHVEGQLEQSSLGSAMTHFRTAYSAMELKERYAKANTQLSKRNMTQEQLCRMVQAKIAERIATYSEQILRARKLFHYFDMNGDSALNEDEYRQLLVFSNVYFDDVEALALFAFLDKDHTGEITWDSFEGNICVQDPQIGHYTIPKSIISPSKAKQSWQLMGLHQNQDKQK